jgi:predicted flap endonuclease-1-like 5' DNA nuclease
MTKQTQGSMTLVGALAGTVFLVAFVALMLVGGYTFSPALFLAATVAGVVALFLVIAFHRKAEAPAHATAHARAHAPAHAPAAAPVSAPAPVAAAPAPTPAPAPAPEPSPAPAATVPDGGTKPTMLAAPRDGGADDLKQIKGVGPKMEAMLHGMGFYHFDQVANWTPAEVAWVDENLEGFKGRVSRDGWVAQAKVLAAGGETEFSKRVGDGGVY